MVVMLVAIVLFSIIKFDSLFLNFLVRIVLIQNKGHHCDPGTMGEIAKNTWPILLNTFRRNVGRPPKATDSGCTARQSVRELSFHAVIVLIADRL